MTDLRTALRTHVETSAPPIDVDLLVARLQHLDDAVVVEGPRPRMRPVLAVAVAFALALVFGVVGWLVLRSTPGDEFVDTTTIPTTTTSPVPTSVPDGARSTTMLESGAPMYTGHHVDIEVTPDGGLFAVYLGASPNDEFFLTFAGCSDASCTDGAQTSTLPLDGFPSEGDVAIGPDGVPTVVFDRGGEEVPPDGHPTMVITCHDAGCAERTVSQFELPANLTPDKVRFYAFQGDTLSLETRDGTRVLARTVWRKSQ